MSEQQNRAGGAARWDSGDAYEPYMGRWSRLVVRELVKWLVVPPGSRWLCSVAKRCCRSDRDDPAVDGGRSVDRNTQGGSEQHYRSAGPPPET